MTELKALIFDVDGTLAETERDGHRVAFNLAFRDAGLDWEWGIQEYGNLLAISGGKERIQYYIEHYDPSLALKQDLDGFIVDLHRRKTEHYLSLLKSGAISLRPGVARLLQEARAAGLRLAVATTTSLENVFGLLESTLGRASSSWFAVYGAGDMVSAKKPAPDIYKFVLHSLGLPPNHCIAIEDSSNGLRAARGAGINTVVTVNTYTRNEDFEDALLVLDHLGEPELPIEVLQGHAGEQCYVTLNLLNQLRSGFKTS